MEAPPLILVLGLICGLFLLIALSLQLWACIRTFTRVRMEKARLKEIERAATERPPPYAIVVLDRNLFPRPPQQHHQQCQCHSQVNGGGNPSGYFDIKAAPPPSTSESNQNPSFPRTESSSCTPPLTSSNGTSSCKPYCTHQRNGDFVSNMTLQRGMACSNEADVISISKTERGNGCKFDIGSEVPPTYEQAIRYSLSEQGT